MDAVTKRVGVLEGWRSSARVLLAALSNRLNVVEKIQTQTEQRMNTIENMMNRIGDRMNRMEEKIDGLEERIQKLLMQQQPTIM